MEGVPRIPMLAFELKPCSESIEFTPVLKSYITSYYHENADAYSKECAELDQLRQSAVQVTVDFMGCSLLKKYYSQLQLLHSRFPMASGEAIEVVFKWEDAYTHQVVAVKDIKFEQACILYNIGSLHSILGGMDNRTTPEGMKVSCTHFQCAAWAFQQVNDVYGSFGSSDMCHELLTFKSTLMLAQAQECILEKSMTDSRKSSITAKVAAQIVDYYKLCLKNLDASNTNHIVGSKRYKEWRRRLETKANFYQCIMYLYLGTQSEEQQKWGERLTYFQAALDRLNEALKLNKAEDAAIEDSLRFTLDVVGGKYNAAKKDNDFVYHDKVPALDTLPDVKGAPLVKGIPFNPSDPEVSGPDIFKKLVPMEAHKASSLYSEEKAKLLRKVGTNIEEKDKDLAQFMVSLQLEPASIFPEPQKLPEALLEKCAAISVKPDAIKDLIDAMQSLSGISTDVEGNLKEIGDLLEENERRDKEMKEVYGTKRSSSAIIDEIRKDAQKCTEGLNKASTSNNELNKLMRLHITNLRLLSGPLEELQQALPTYNSSFSAEDDATMQEMKRLMDKVDEMKSQRCHLEQQLRDQVHKDDITSALVTKESKNLEEFFDEQIGKHSRLVDLLNQNMAAQANILRALTEANAKYARIRRDLLEVNARRDTMVRSIIQSYEVYEDLLAKTQKGVEFYGKLDSNVSRLLERTRSVYKIEQEERDKILERLAPKGPTPARPTAPKPGQFPMPQPLRLPDPSLGFPEMPPLPPLPGQFNLPSYGSGGVGPYAGEAAASDAPKLKDFLPFMKPGSFGPKSTRAGMSDARGGASSNAGAASFPGELPPGFDYRGSSYQVTSQQPGSLPNSHSASPVHLPQLSASHPPSPLTVPGQPNIQSPGNSTGGERANTNAGSNGGSYGTATTMGGTYPTFRSNGLDQGPVGGASSGPVGGATGSGVIGLPGADSVVSPTAPPGAPGSAPRVDQSHRASISTNPSYAVAHPGGPTEQPSRPQIPQSNHPGPVITSPPIQSQQFAPGQPRASPSGGYSMSQQYPSSQCLPAQSSQPNSSQPGPPGSASPGGYCPGGMSYAVAPSHPGSMSSVQGAALGLTSHAYTGQVQPAPSGPHGPGPASGPYGPSSVEYSAGSAQVPSYQPGQGTYGLPPRQFPGQSSVGQGQPPHSQHERFPGQASVGQGQQPLRQPQGLPFEAAQNQGPQGQGPVGQVLPGQVPSQHRVPGSYSNQQFIPSLPNSSSAGVGHSQPYLVSSSQQYPPSDQQRVAQAQLQAIQSIGQGQQPQRQPQGLPFEAAQNQGPQGQGPIGQVLPGQVPSHHSEQQRVAQAQLQALQDAARGQMPSGSFQVSASGSPLHAAGNQHVQYMPPGYGANTGVQDYRIPGVSQSYNVPGGPYPSQPVAASSYQQPQPVAASQQRQPVAASQQQQPVGPGSCQQPQPVVSSYQAPQPVGAGSYQQPQPVGGGSYQQPQPVGGGSYQQPQPVGGGSYQQPQLVGGGSYQQPQPVGGGSYQQPQPVGGGSYQQPQPVGGGSYQQPQPVTGSSYQQPQPVGTTSYQHLQNSYQQQPPAIGTYQQPTGTGPYQQPPQLRPGSYQQQISTIPQSLAPSSASTTAYQQLPQSGTSQYASAYPGTSQQAPVPSGASQQMPAYPGASQQAPVPSGAGQQVSTSSGAFRQMPAYTGAQPAPAGQHPTNASAAASHQVLTYPGPSHQTPAYPGTSQPAPAHPGTNEQVYPAMRPHSMPTQAPAAGFPYQAPTYIHGQVAQPGVYPTATAAAGIPSTSHPAQSNWYPPNSFKSPTQEIPSSLPSPLHPIKPLATSSDSSSAKVPSSSGGASSDVPPAGAFDGATDTSAAPYLAQSSTERRNSVSSNASSTLDELLSASPKSQPLSSGAEHVLIPKVITAEDRRREREEETRKSLKQSTRDPYTDPDLLGRFVAEAEKFQKHVDALCRETLGKYTPLEKEWKELNDDQEKTAKQFSMAIARCYPLKNRYPDVMPFDNTRVKLTGAADDYINASHLTSETVSCPEFIATQSPLPATFVDFWQMIHDQGAEVIVMLCAEVEPGAKNHPYWPQEKGQTIMHGSFHLTLQSIKTKPDWIERILTISHKTTRQSRSVVHMQFLKWPPAGVPESPAALLQFISEIHNFYIQQRSLMRPVVVHCSNGIGRTGAFSVIYTGIQEINQGHGIINIPELITSLRRKRKCLVQHKEQLKFCYDAILYYAQDLLMKRGILTTKASFGDKLPHPGDKTHSRNPSEDFVFGHSNISSLQSSVAKLSTHQHSTQSQAATVDANASATTRSPASVSPPSVPEASEAPFPPQEKDADKATTPTDVPLPTTNGKEVAPEENGSCQSSLAMPIDASSEISASSSAANSRPGSASLNPVLLSLADLQNPSTFKMDPSQPTKKKITKASFLNPSRSLAEGSTDPSDPLSQLDPLWSLKDKANKS